MFIKAYVARIKAGQMTIDDVPEFRLVDGVQEPVREKVQEALDEDSKG